MPSMLFSHFFFSFSALHLVDDFVFQHHSSRFSITISVPVLTLDKLNSFPAIAFELFSSMARALGL